MNILCFRSVYIVYTMIGDVCVYVVGKDEYDELACENYTNCYFILFYFSNNLFNILLPILLFFA